MNTSVKQQIAESVCGFRLPRYKEIPDVGLYLEQTTKYINGYLAPLGCMELTTSMLSNYVKKGLVPNPVKKQYFAEHIAHTIFVTIAKNIISLEDVRLMLDMKEQSYSTPVAYDYMCAELENMILYIFGFKKVWTSAEKHHLTKRIFYTAFVIQWLIWCICTQDLNQ